MPKTPVALTPGCGNAFVEFDGEADEPEWYKNPITQVMEARFARPIDLAYRNPLAHLNR